MNLMMLAIIPGILILFYVYRKDKIEKEPIPIILLVMFLGALSCILAAIIEGILDSIYPSFPEGSLGFAIVNGVFCAAFVEEIVKYIALRLPTWRRPEFNYRFDGIVYGVSSAIGFALFENVGYVLQYGFSTAIVRAFTAVPLHSFCGVFMGIFYAYSKKAEIVGKKDLQRKATLYSLIVPMCIHGIYDTFAMWNNPLSVLIFLAFVIVTYVISIRQIRKVSETDEQGSFYPQTPKKELTVLSHIDNEIIAELNVPSYLYFYNSIQKNEVDDIVIKYSRGLQHVTKEDFLNRFASFDTFERYFANETIEWGIKLKENNITYTIQGNNGKIVKIKKC